MTERRRFVRILYQAPATLRQGQIQLTTCIQDLSLHGLLLWAIDEPSLDPSQPLDVEFTLPDSEITLNMTAMLVRTNERILHLKISHIDIESIAHLKRIVELNLGDSELLSRDIEHLIDIEDDAHHHD
ncbi:PilZ domain-containing protein [Vibrio sp.]|uniref:PilZ domain-containing protein n=1 Tax=Vibrio sp. TaxID=678 RepID=UPI003D11D42B